MLFQGVWGKALISQTKISKSCSIRVSTVGARPTEQRENAPDFLPICDSTFSLSVRTPPHAVHTCRPPLCVCHGGVADISVADAVRWAAVHIPYRSPRQPDGARLKGAAWLGWLGCRGVRYTLVKRGMRKQARESCACLWQKSTVMESGALFLPQSGAAI